MTARRLLIVSPAFPPHPSPATHRARFLARYGPACGWDVEIVAVDPAHYEEQLDHELTRLVPSSARITHVPALDARWTRRVGVGDIALRAYAPMRRHLDRMVTARRPDVVFIPGGPFYTFRLGAAMRQRHGVPYVVDYTDPWVYALTPSQNTPWAKAYWARQLALRLEPRVVRNASHILAVSDGTNAEIRARYPDVPADRFSAFPFGFEATDFDALRANPRPNPWWDAADGRVHFVYVGAMLPHGYETLRAVFAAVGSLVEREPGMRDRVRLHFFGTTYDPNATEGLVIPVARSMGLGDVVTEHPRRIPYLEALNVLTSADAILALGSTEHHYTASKIFPCLLARRPMLAAYHAASTVCDIMRQVDGAELVTYDDEARAETRTGELAAAIRRIVEAPVTPGPLPHDALGAFSAETISRRIFALFDRVAGEAGAAMTRSA